MEEWNKNVISKRSLIVSSTQLILLAYCSTRATLTRWHCICTCTGVCVWYAYPITEISKCRIGWSLGSSIKYCKTWTSGNNSTCMFWVWHTAWKDRRRTETSGYVILFKLWIISAASMSPGVWTCLKPIGHIRRQFALCPKCHLPKQNINHSSCKLHKNE